MAEEESIIESFIEAIEGTKSTAEFLFENGKVSVTALPIHTRGNE